MDDTAPIDKYLTLSQAARHAPGKPTPNCLWRWCRKGVAARGGRRIYLYHVRSGGKLFTTAEWVRAFGRELTEADQAHFDAKRRAGDDLPGREPRYGPSPTKAKDRPDPTEPTGSADLSADDDLERELREEGL